MLGVVRQGGGAPEVTRDIRGEGGGNVKRQRGGGAMRLGQARRGNAIRTELYVPRSQTLTVQVKECIIFITHLLNRSLNAF